MATANCSYIKPDGLFCGSPALRGRNHCYFHLTCAGRRLRAQRQQREFRDGPAVELPPLEDANSIQIGIMQVLDAAARGRINPKLCGTMLYGLQVASSNLKNVNFNTVAQPQQDMCDSYQHFEEDYDIVGHADGLQGPPEEEPAEENRPAGAGQPQDSEYSRNDREVCELLRRASETPDLNLRARLLEDYYILKERYELRGEAGTWLREAGRQNMLFDRRKPPASAAAPGMEGDASSTCLG